MKLEIWKSEWKSRRKYISPSIIKLLNLHSTNILQRSNQLKLDKSSTVLEKNKLHEYLRRIQFHLHALLIVISSETIVYYVEPAESINCNIKFIH